ncbi:hypothetical protein [Cupriavidus basilensis]|uniref:Glycosaminoglycan attachment site n=1 Tax=Cupriavidus basilensis TaxID=68895 RepID=A0A643FM21_9BURK|nr:hypothetical protein [Cupriavidus basilensis]QOT76329.1 hypothetical protein F7R26_019735 [Cupriavidus basilensis]
MPIDLFADLGRPNSELHPQFVALRDLPGYAPARGLIRELQEHFVDADGNFVEQFQTFAFDARTFEFYLAAMFKAIGHEIDRSVDRPDFLISKNGVTAAVEAVTANPPPGKGIQPYSALVKDLSPDEVVQHFENTVPIRLGSPLFSKLKKQYWLLPHVAGRPLVLAIQDFHTAGSLMSSSAPLMRYLYGLGHQWWHDASGKLVIEGYELVEHQLGTKKIPSGFFFQPDAEYISAVLFCNSGTIPKFNRMGHQGKYQTKGVRMLRCGTCYRHDPNATMPKPFVYEVGSPDREPETWAEGTVLLRNPNALHPLPSEWLGASAEENLVDGTVVTTFAEPFLPYMSMTKIFHGASRGDLRKEAEKLAKALLSIFPS